ncbi:MAG: RNA-binding S4 domain-containing protein [Planctomycetaceae bacterium]|nr:RNA-binding S4 domain-containing protein [Planctomycetaceae bacterium]
MPDGEPISSTPEETIDLDRFLKLADIVGTGGQAKHLIRSGAVLVNDEMETRRGRKLRDGDVVTVNGEDYVIEATPDE